MTARHYPRDVANFAATALVALLLCALLAAFGLSLYHYGTTAEGVPMLFLGIVGLGAFLVRARQI